jgi:ABC-type Na+ efflux pump permease subunit
MQRTLDWNPIAWLQQYSWKSRLTKWGLCLAFVLVECVTGGSFNFDNNPSVHCAELLTLAAIYTFAGVSGFLEEKRNGALELLLVTPLPVDKLIFGRVWGLWKQFLPAALVLAVSYAGWLWNNPGDWEFNTAIPGPIILACVFLTLPVFATYFALRVKNLFVAAVLTWVALYLPLAFVIAAFGVNQSNIILMLPAFPITYAAFALLACFLLRHSLSRRIYSF